MAQPSAPLPRYEDVINVEKANFQNQEAPIQVSDQEPGITINIKCTKADLKTLLHIVNTVTQFLLGGVVLSAVMIANSGQINGNKPLFRQYPDTFKQHIYLCVTGYMVLMSQAILSFNPHGGWAHGLKHPQKRMIHAVMQVMGSVLALAGCILKISDWNYYPTTNSGHAVTGWIVMFLTFLSLIGGILNFKYHEKMSQGWYKHIHPWIGYMVIFMAFLCLAFAFGDRYYYFNDYVNSDLSVTFTVFAMVGILISAVFTKIK